MPAALCIHTIAVLLAAQLLDGHVGFTTFLVCLNHNGAVHRRHHDCTRMMPCFRCEGGGEQRFELCERDLQKHKLRCSLSRSVMLDF